MSLVIKGEKKFFHVFEIRQEDYENGIQTLVCKAVPEGNTDPNYPVLEWVEKRKYSDELIEVFYRLREIEETEYGEYSRYNDYQIYKWFLPYISTIVDDGFYQALIARRNE